MLLQKLCTEIGCCKEMGMNSTDIKNTPNNLGNYHHHPIHSISQIIIWEIDLGLFFIHSSSFSIMIHFMMGNFPNEESCRRDERCQLQVEYTAARQKLGTGLPEFHLPKLAAPQRGKG